MIKREKLANKNYCRREFMPSEARIAHIGVGNFHRSHQAVYTNIAMQRNNDYRWGIKGIGVHPAELALHEKMRHQDYTYTLLIKDNNHISQQTISSIVGLMHIQEHLASAKSFIAKPDTKLITMTVTEGGYYINQNTGEFLVDHPDIEHDRGCSEVPKTVYGFLLAALLQRYNDNQEPLTIISCDNVQGNGDCLRRAFYQFVEQDGRLPLQWIDDQISFPSTMVDRITPQYDKSDLELCIDCGVYDECSVSAEPFIQWVIEDNFVNERPEWEQAGATIVKDVSMYEKVKLRLLNASHQALAYLGLLSGYRTVSSAMADELIGDMIRRYMRDEASLGLTSLPGLSLEQYQQKVIERFSNVSIVDTLQRISSFSSDRIVTFVLPSFIENAVNGAPTALSNLLIAAWISYCKKAIETDLLPDVIDNNLSFLKELVSIADSHPKQIYSHHKVFSALSGNQLIAEEFKHYYQCIQSKGVKIAMKDIGIDGRNHER